MEHPSSGSRAGYAPVVSMSSDDGDIDISEYESSRSKNKSTQTILSESKHLHSSQVLCYNVGCWTSKTKNPPWVSKELRQVKRSVSQVAQKRIYGFDENPLRFIASLFPLFSRFHSYTWAFVLKDFIAGCVVAMIHLPQAMAGAMTAVMRPQHGLFMTIIPGLVYAFLASSAQNSMGGMPITAALAGVSMARIREEYHPENDTMYTAGEMLDLHFEIAGALTLACGAFQIAMGIFKLGFLSRLMSSNVIDPFSVACCLQAILGQMPSMFGVGLYPYCGLAKHPWLLTTFLADIPRINVWETLMSVLAASIILGFREFVQPVLYKKTSMIYPVEFFVMIAAGVTSYCLDLNGQYGVRIIGAIPESFPTPETPSLHYLPHVLGEGFISALVSFGLTINSAKVLARKEKDKIWPSQELIATGTSNVFGSFFSCFVSAAPIGRSIINQSLGSRSQLSSIFGSLFMLVLFLSVGQSLTYLPTCIVSTNIVVTLIMTLKIFGDLPALWRGSRLDAIIWMTTFVSCIALDVRVGLILGIMCSLFSVTYRTQKPKVRILGRMAEIGGYLPLKYYKQAEEIPGIKILQIQSSVHFGNAEYLVKLVKALTFATGVAPPREPQTILVEQNSARSSWSLAPGRTQSSLKLTVRKLSDVLMQELLPNTARVAQSTPNLSRPSRDLEQKHFVELSSNGMIKKHPGTAMLPDPEVLALQESDEEEDHAAQSKPNASNETIVLRVVIDLSMASFIDSVGLRALEQLASDFEKLDMELLLSQTKGSLTHQIKKLNILKNVPPKNIFISVEDAVKAAAKRNLKMSGAKNHVLREKADKRFWPTPTVRVEGLPGTN